jgi:hypothetical protein
VHGGSRPPADARAGRCGLPLPRVPAHRRDRAANRVARMIRRALLVAVALGLVSPSYAADISILGTWRIVDAQGAPWVAPATQAALAAAGKRMVNTEVIFAAGSVKSKFKPWDCKSKVIYTPNSIEVDALFQGNLPEPNPAAAAARLGFARGKDVPGVDVRCLKALFTFHFRDPNTALINLDRVIYTLKRQ